MLFLRSLLYLIWFYGLSAVMVLCFFWVLLLPPRFSLELGRRWAAILLAGARIICGLRHEIRGLENLPPGACLVAAKHQSAFETLLLPQYLGDFRYVLKQELTHIPLFGWYLRRSGQIAVDRKGGGKALRAMLAQARTAAAQGCRIAIFPEGTRTAPGQRDAPYHPGVAALYGDLAVPAVPVALNSGLFWRRKAFLKHPGTIVVSFLEPIPPGLERRAFRAELRRRIEEETEKLEREAGGAA